MQLKQTISSNIKPIAVAGLTTKGIVYSLLGFLVVMEAFQIQGQSGEQTSKSGVFGFIYDLPGGRILLAAVGLGLVSYCIWRFIQAFIDTGNKGKGMKGLAKRFRYLFSGLVYGSLAFYALKIAFVSKKSSGDGNQQAVAELLSKPFGQYLVGVAALILIAVGVYQIYYGLSEKHEKHVRSASNSKHEKPLLTSGKIGYVARGIVWLLIAWLIVKAAVQASSAPAGDTAKALQFLQDAPYGSYLLAAVGLGLISYGVFNFVRAKYENFG